MLLYATNTADGLDLYSRFFYRFHWDSIQLTRSPLDFFQLPRSQLGSSMVTGSMTTHTSSKLKLEDEK
jgi:hypothetical protein